MVSLFIGKRFFISIAPVIRNARHFLRKCSTNSFFDVISGFNNCVDTATPRYSEVSGSMKPDDSGSTVCNSVDLR